MLSRRGEPSFNFDQFLLAPKAAAVTRQRSIRADDAMTGNDNRNLICAVGLGYRTYGSWPAEFMGDLAVRPSRSSGDPQQAFPDRSGERGSVERERHGELRRLSVEECLQFSFQQVRRRGPPQPDTPFCVPVQGLQLLRQRPAVSEFQQMDLAMVRYHNHLPQCGIDPIEVQEAVLNEG